MRKDDYLIFENYVDSITKTKNALGGHIMSIVKHGIPSKEEFIKIRQELHDNVEEIQARGTPATEEEKARAQEIIAKIKNYRSQHPHDPTPLNQEENAEEGLLRVRITDYIEDKKEGIIDKNFTINVSLKAFDVKNIVHSFVSYIYGKYDQDRVKGATRAVLNGITDSDVNSDNNRIELSISEFPGDGMDHYVEAQLLQKEENEETPEERQERVRRKWELNKKRWAKWKAENPEKAKLNAQRKAGIYGKKEENAEDMSKSPFHYDPMHGLASAAHKIRDELRGAANDEARPEHIEKMAEIILGPQSEYSSVDHYEKALSGVIELLNHYVVVSMN